MKHVKSTNQKGKSQKSVVSRLFDICKTIFVFGIAFLVLGWVSLELGVFSPAYIFGFWAGSIEVLVILIFIFLIRPRIAEQTRKKIFYYSIQLILGPIFILTLLSTLFISGEEVAMTVFIAWVAAFLLWWTLVALVIKFRWWVLIILMGALYVFEQQPTALRTLSTSESWIRNTTKLLDRSDLELSQVLVGVWQDDPRYGGGGLDRHYRFFENGRYVDVASPYPHETEDEARFLLIAGNWQLNTGQDRIILEPMYNFSIDGGNFFNDPKDPFDGYITGDCGIDVSVAFQQSGEFPINYLGMDEDGLKQKVNFGGTTFYQFYRDPWSDSQIFPFINSGCGRIDLGRIIGTDWDEIWEEIPVFYD